MWLFLLVLGLRASPSLPPKVVCMPLSELKGAEALCLAAAVQLLMAHVGSGSDGLPFVSAIAPCAGTKRSAGVRREIAVTAAGIHSIRHRSNRLLWHRHSIKAVRHICFVRAMLHMVLFLRAHPEDYLSMSHLYKTGGHPLALDNKWLTHTKISLCTQKLGHEPITMVGHQENSARKNAYRPNSKFFIYCF